jgi:hypothetical protein
MTRTSIFAKTVLLSAMASAAFIATPAMAASNKDVQTCRTAFAEKGEINMNDYRLRYERQDGQRTKVIHFTAIPHEGGESLEVSCTLRRTKVLALNSGEGKVKRFAKNEKK